MYKNLVKIRRFYYFSKVILFGSDISFNELRKICAFLERCNFHFLYELILNRYDPKIKFLKNIKNKSFIGSGCGSGNLNVYRKIINEKEPLFEKIYIKDFIDYSNIKEFYNNQYKNITDLGICTPGIRKIKEGNKLCIVYFEFFKLGKPRNYEVAINVSNILYKNRGLPVLLNKNIDNEYVFSRGERRFVRYLKSVGVNTKMYMNLKERLLQGLPVYFQHGDLTANCFDSNWVLDWDRSGYYPFGVDYGWIIADMLNLKKIQLSDIDNFVTDLVSKNDLPHGTEKIITYFSIIYWLSRSKFESQINLELVDWLRDKDNYFIYECESEN